jgi:hypothetical protein
MNELYLKVEREDTAHKEHEFRFLNNFFMKDEKEKAQLVLNRCQHWSFKSLRIVFKCSALVKFSGTIQTFGEIW